MAINQRYPYTDIHELNLDWILAKMKELKIEFDEFKVVNQISFSGAWDITKNYPAWTIVSDNNIGYVSIQPVPAGVLLTNNDYWREVIDYSAQIAGLQNRVVNLENEDIIIHGDIAALDAKVDANFDLLTKHRYILISDSYGTIPANDTWIDKFISDLGLTPNDDVFSSAVAGAGFKPGYNSYFITYLQNLENTVTDHDTITDIVVVGGFNDRGTTPSDLDSAISAFCSYCKTTYKNAKIWIGAFGWSMNGEYQSELLNGYYMPSYMNCSTYGANYLNGSDYIMHNFANFTEEAPGYTPLYLNKQYVHPNATGSQLIANCVKENIFGKGFNYKDYAGVTMTPATGVTFQYANCMRHVIKNDKIIVSFNQTRVDFSSAQSDNGTNWIELATIPAGCISGTNNANAFIPCMQIEVLIAGGNLTSTDPNTIPLMLGFFNNRLYMKFVTPTGKNFDVMYILKGYAEFSNVMV